MTERIPRFAAIVLLIVATAIVGTTSIKTPPFDLVGPWSAGRAVLHGGEPYSTSLRAVAPAEYPRDAETPRFIYPPSSLFASLVLAILPFRLARIALIVLSLVCLVGATAALLGLSRWGFWPGAAVIALVLISSPARTTVAFGNYNALILAGQVVFLYALTRHRDAYAGVALGLTLALKPVLLPVIVFLLIERRWRCVLLALAIPLALSVLSVLTIRNSGEFVASALPFLLSGEGQRIASNVSVAGIASSLGMSPLISGVVRAVIAVAGALLVAGFARRDRWPANLNIMLSSSVILAAGFACLSFALGYYTLFLLPLVLSGLVAGGKGARTALVLAAAMCAVPRIPLLPPAAENARFLVGWLILVGVAGWFFWRYLAPLEKSGRQPGSTVQIV